MEISKKQKEILDLMADPQLTELLVGGSAGCASVYGQEVKTPFGVKKIEDIKIGDQISNVNGGVARVIDIPYDGYIECFGVTFSDGAYTEVSKNHLWKYKVAGNKRNGHEGRRHLTEYVIGTTEQLREKIDKEHILIPLTKPVVFTRSFPYTDKMAPYLLGVLLGDGGFSQPQGSVLITNPDKEIIEKCRREISGEIIHVRDELTWRLVNCDIEKRRLEKFGLRGKHSWEKFIPECYKLGSIEERLEILRGLIDTDGYVDKGGRLYFTSSSRRLAEDVQFIARSLGANATLTVGPAGYKKDGEYIKCRDSYTVYIQHEHKEWFVTLPRKRDRVKPYNGGYAPCKRIIKIEPIGIKHARCLTTSEIDGLYLTNDFIVTHNSKSFSIGLLIALWSKMYPGVRFFVGRKTLKSLKQSTINTLLNKVFPALGITYDEYRMHFQDMTLDFVNGSTIIFGELDWMPSDTDYARLGSLEIDIAVVDEAGEITQEAKNALKSRTGRGVLAQNYGIPGKLLMSCNPQQGWLKTEFYDVFEKNGGGFFQKWPFGEVEIKGEKKPAYRAFLRMWAYDNPFLPESYIDNLKALPDRERKRLLEGNWNYADDDNMLFKSGLLDKATTYDLPSGEFDSYIGVDVSDRGKDKSVFTLIKNGIVVNQKVSAVQMNWDTQSEKPLGRLLADELVAFAMQNGFSSKDAKRIAVECNGVGASIRDNLKLRGWYIYEYVATHKTRSEGFYQLMLDFDDGSLKLYHEMAGLDNLRKELAAHTYEMREQTPDVCKKDKIKQVLGHSPDFADSLMIASYIRHIHTDKKDDRHNANRIVF